MRLNGYDYEFTQLACDYVKKGIGDNLIND